MKAGQIVKARKGYDPRTSQYVLDLIPGNNYILIDYKNSNHSALLSGTFIDCFGTLRDESRVGFDIEDIQLATQIRRK